MNNSRDIIRNYREKYCCLGFYAFLGYFDMNRFILGGGVKREPSKYVYEQIPRAV